MKQLEHHVQERTRATKRNLDTHTPPDPRQSLSRAAYFFYELFPSVRPSSSLRLRRRRRHLRLALPRAQPVQAPAVHRLDANRRHVVPRTVAAQVDPFEKADFETGFSLDGFKG
jgi:hypothetical protein